GNHGFGVAGAGGGGGGGVGAGGGNVGSGDSGGGAAGTDADAGAGAAAPGVPRSMIMNSTRRVSERAGPVLVGATGFSGAKASASRRVGSIPAISTRCATTELARSCDNLTL